jgi:hypothetical protein
MAVICNGEHGKLTDFLRSKYAHKPWRRLRYRPAKHRPPDQTRRMPGTTGPLICGVSESLSYHMRSRCRSELFEIRMISHARGNSVNLPLMIDNCTFLIIFLVALIDLSGSPQKLRASCEAKVAVQLASVKVTKVLHRSYTAILRKHRLPMST